MFKNPILYDQYGGGGGGGESSSPSPTPSTTQTNITGPAVSVNTDTPVDDNSVRPNISTDDTLNIDNISSKTIDRTFGRIDDYHLLEYLYLH